MLSGIYVVKENAAAINHGDGAKMTNPDFLPERQEENEK